jgi:hypothetical protein
MGGPLAQAKKLTDPKGYERVVQTKMKQDGLTRQQAEDDYNQFLENPPFYYALDKKEEYYKSLGYKDMFEVRTNYTACVAYCVDSTHTVRIYYTTVR